MTTKESGVYDLRCLCLPVPLSEIDVPERSWRFGATRGDEAEPFLDSSAVSRQRPCCTPRFSSLATAESAEGKVFAWLDPRFHQAPACPAALARSKRQAVTSPFATGAAAEKAQHSLCASRGKCGGRVASKTSGHCLSTGCCPLGILYLVCAPQYLSLCKEISTVARLRMILMLFP